MTPGVTCRQRHALHPGHVAGEAGHGHAAMLDAAHQLAQGPAHVRLGPAVPIDHGVRAVAHHGQHALLAECGKGRLVGRRPNHRVRVKLPVARVQDGAELGADHQRLRFRQGVRDGQELQVERADLELAAGLHDVNPDLVDQPGFPQLALEDGGGERRRIDRAAHLPPQVGDCADVVLVRMGDDQGQQVVPPLGDETGVGHHDLDLGVLVAPETDAAVDRQPLPAGAVEIKVHAYLARPT